MRHLKAFEQELFARHGEPENQPGENADGPGFSDVAKSLRELIPGAKARVRLLEHTPPTVASSAEFIAFVEDSRPPVLVGFFSLKTVMVVFLSVIVSVVVSGTIKLIQQSIPQ